MEMGGGWKEKREVIKFPKQTKKNPKQCEEKKNMQLVKLMLKQSKTSHTETQSLECT